MNRILWFLTGTAVCLGLADAKIVPGKGFDRFITIWLENQDYAKVVVDESIKDLKKQGILLTRYYAHTHPSQPNYVASIGGDYFGMNHDEMARIPTNVSTVVDLLESREISWAGYFENLPGPGFMGNYSDGPTGGGTWDYVRKHNPFVTYDSVTSDGERLLCLLSFDDFQRAFRAKQVPQFVFMTPNMMNDGHNTTLKVAADWSHKFLQPLLAEKAFDEKTLIMLTYDESETYEEPNHIVTLLLGSAIPEKLRGTEDNTFYTHYSMLSTLEYNWGLPHLGRYDVGANVFQYVADMGGYKKNKDPANLGTINNSVSYPGFLHNDTSQFMPVPSPNLKLVGASGLGILDVVAKTWPATKDATTPYDGSGNVYDAETLPVYSAPAANTL
ncbi:putative acid phosphatase [Echria macrotheca]|uniref:Acid phosphatase n=1 Tax=Echria macrotheca TaxID=438768 RepID=A0AAJ0BQC2_9PEZI|nr:putative acid phosphatase [Echria macrotheca]